MKRRKSWGWGYEDEAAPAASVAFAEASLGALFGGPGTRRDPPDERQVDVPAPRVAVPDSLAPLFDPSKHERLVHALGRSYRDLARAVRGRFPHAPDLVAFPRSEEDIARLLDFAGDARIAVVPFGGGTSVAGGVEPEVGARHRATLSLDLRELSGVTAVDETSLLAEIRGGTLGPDLEHALRPRGLTLRHYPQSFEMSTLGGWIVTRAGGHFATVYTHIDDLVAGLRMVTPAGTLETRTLPGSGAGPAPERLVLGSEGILGVVTSAWMRVFRRPVHRAACTARFSSFEAGLDALRAITQAGLTPANCRLVDGAEAIMSGAGLGDVSLMFLAFESASLPQRAPLDQAIDIARAHGAAIGDEDIKIASGTSSEREGVAEGYRASFFRAPYLRDELVLRGIFVETYETAAPWSRIRELDEAVRRVVASLDLGPHLFARRVTHAYRDGCAPYYTLIAKERDDAAGESMWREVKTAITEAIVRAGGTATHHHAIGRDVVPHHEAERSPLFEEALRAVKSRLDPRGVMNPGVLLRERDE